MTTTIETEKLTETVGAQVHGADVDTLLHDPDVPAWTLDALEANGVLVFRGLGIDDTSQVAFSKRLGRVEVFGTGENPEIFLVTLDPAVKDANEMPVASVHYDDHPNDIAMRNHAYQQGAAVYDAVGATRTFPTPPYPSTHNLGTNRMSEKPRDGVVDKYGQTHDVKNLFVSDGSQFTTSAACNPTLTIVALAIRQADHIAGSMARKEI